MVSVNPSVLQAHQNFEHSKHAQLSKIPAGYKNPLPAFPSTLKS